MTCGNTSSGVSIVIPCFNQGNFLKEAIESVLAQTIRPERIVVVDDGSTDNTAAVARKFPGIDYVFQENRGLSGARNTGLRRVTTPLVMFHDSDDVLKPTAIESCVNTFEEHPKVAFVYGGFWWVDQNRRFVGEELAKPQTDHFGALLAKNYIMMHGTVMYRTEILRSSGGFDERLPRCEDYDVYLRLTKDYPVASYEGVAAEYRRHGENISLNAALMLKTARSVLSRYASVAQTSAAWHAAYAEGLGYFTNFWGIRVEQSFVEEWKGKRRPGVLASLIATGLRYDPKFAVRLGARIARKIATVCGSAYHRSGLDVMRMHGWLTYLLAGEQARRRKIFSDIYRHDVWGTDEGNKYFSGIGSRGEAAKIYVERMAELLKIHIAELGRSITIVDLGCGDFAVGHALVAKIPNLIYIGCDTVPELVSYNQKKYGSAQVSFCQLDIVTDPLPEGDIYLVRQVLQHLSNSDIIRFLEHANCKYLYVSDGHPVERVGPVNPDKITGADVRFDHLTGRGRGVELDQPPYSLITREIFRAFSSPTEIVITYLISGMGRSQLVPE